MHLLRSSQARWEFPVGLCLAKEGPGLATQAEVSHAEM